MTSTPDLRVSGLSLEGLSLGHPLPGSGWRQLFSSFSLNCPPGQFLVVIGSNGSGKSTLLNLLVGTLRHVASRVHLGEPYASPEGLPGISSVLAGLAG
jgi:putative tryptophan/tyrosine transport system ATP-binding protein